MSDTAELTQLQITPYAELLALTADEKKKKTIPARVNSQKKKAELKIAQIEEQLADINGTITEMCASESLDIEAINKKINEFALLSRSHEQMTKIVAQLFPANATPALTAGGSSAG